MADSMLEKLLAAKGVGNEAYKTKDYDTAIKEYAVAVKLLPPLPEEDDSDDEVAVMPQKKRAAAPAPPAKKAKEEPPAKKAKGAAPPPAPAPAAGAPVNAWTKEEDAKFAKASAQFPDGTEGRWAKIAAAVGTRSAQQCKKKAKS